MIRGLSPEWPHRGERRAATKFRQGLLDQGYEMSQLSVYMRFCVGKEQLAGAVPGGHNDCAREG